MTTTTEPIRIGIPIPGELGTIHRDHRLLGSLLAGTPAWAATANALNLIATSKPAGLPAQPTEVLDAVADIIVSSVEQSQAPPDDLLQQATAARAELETRGLVLSAFNRAASHLVPKLDDALRDAENDLYAALDDLLQDVVDRGRSIAHVADLLDAAAVLANGRHEDHEAWTQIASTYAQIRDAQAKLASKLSRWDITAHTEPLVMRGVETVFPHWAPWRARGYLVAAHDVRQKSDLRPPWPLQSFNPAQLRLASDAGAPEFLVWALAVGADLWVPTSKEYDAERVRLAAMRSNPDAEPEPVIGDDGTEYVQGPAYGPRRARGLSQRQAGGWNPPRAADPYDSAADIADLIGGHR